MQIGCVFAPLFALKLIKKMDYLEYKTASERHLETCLKLKDIVMATYSKTSLTLDEEKKKNELLANIYYLSGYVIECIVSYSILKFIDFDSIRNKHGITEVKQLKFYHTNGSNNNYGVAYGYRDIGNRFTPYACRWSIYSQAHKLTPNLTFFTVEANLTGLGIRGIDVPLTGYLKDMLKKWDAETRYQINSGNLNQKDRVFEFLDLAEHIHVNLFRQSQTF